MTDLSAVYYNFAQIGIQPSELEKMDGTTAEEILLIAHFKALKELKDNKVN